MASDRQRISWSRIGWLDSTASVAMRFGRELKCFYRRLYERGEPGKVTLGAVMRKLQQLTAVAR